MLAKQSDPYPYKCERCGTGEAVPMVRCAACGKARCGTCATGTCCGYTPMIPDHLADNYVPRIEWKDGRIFVELLRDGAAVAVVMYDPLLGFGMTLGMVTSQQHYEYMQELQGHTVDLAHYFIHRYLLCARCQTLRDFEEVVFVMAHDHAHCKDEAACQQRRKETAAAAAAKAGGTRDGRTVN